MRRIGYSSTCRTGLAGDAGAADRIFVYLPHLGSLTGAPPPDRAYRDGVLAAARDAGFRIVDLEPRLADGPRAFYSLGIGPHLNAKGNAAVAAGLGALLPACPAAP